MLGGGGGGGEICDGLVSHPGGVAILLVALCYGNRDKLRQYWASRLVRINLTFNKPFPQ